MTKRKDRRVRLVVKWYGRTIRGHREAVCWMCIYDFRSNQRYAMSFVLSQTCLEQAFVTGDWTGFLLMVSHRWRRTMQQLREGWRNAVLGEGWRERKYARRRAAFEREWVPCDMVIDCSYCGAVHAVEQHRVLPQVTYECDRRRITSPTFVARRR